jgi:hypothetical protein
VILNTAGEKISVGKQEIKRFEGYVAPSVDVDLSPGDVTEITAIPVKRSQPQTSFEIGRAPRYATIGREAGHGLRLFRRAGECGTLARASVAVPMADYQAVGPQAVGAWRNRARRCQSC